MQTVTFYRVPLPFGYNEFRTLADADAYRTAQNIAAAAEAVQRDIEIVDM